MLQVGLELYYFPHFIAEETQQMQEKMTKFIYPLSGWYNLNFMALKVKSVSGESDKNMES